MVGLVGASEVSLAVAIRSSSPRHAKGSKGRQRHREEGVTKEGDRYALYRCSPLPGRGPGGRYGVVAVFILSAARLFVAVEVAAGAFKPVI